LEKKLGMRGTFQHDQFLGLGSFIVLRANTWKPWAGIVAVIAGDDEIAFVTLAFLPRGSVLHPEI
jgi:hypothetical protein